ncbi:MAG: hypothetical protein WEA59_04185 [Ferruginibacter sp.]
MKLLFKVGILIISYSQLSSCKPFKQETCELGDCDSRRLTKFAAIDEVGKIVYDNSIDKWGVESLVLGNTNGRRIAYICGPLNDTFKIIDKVVRYSGSLKESCGVPRPAFLDQEIFYVLPTSIR